jgi:hypothetical protein
VLFITIVRPRLVISSISSITVQTAERSASPEYVGGVSTQMQRKSAASSASSTSSTKRRRSRFRSTSAARPGSWIGTWPARSASIFSGRMSRTVTS